MSDIAWYCVVLYGIALYSVVLYYMQYMAWYGVGTLLAPSQQSGVYADYDSVVQEDCKYRNTQPASKTNKKAKPQQTTITTDLL